ncbi:MAG: hypothetical protein GY941_25160, partial [Planctomycetes bacterium]|nr:hypothetical protein [Planctomycetota bacterium]
MPGITNPITVSTESTTITNANDGKIACKDCNKLFKSIVHPIHKTMTRSCLGCKPIKVTFTIDQSNPNNNPNTITNTTDPTTTPINPNANIQSDNTMSNDGNSNTNQCIHCDKYFGTGTAAAAVETCDNCTKLVAEDNFRRFLNLNIILMAIDEDGRYQRCKLATREVGTKANPWVNIIWEPKVATDGTTEQTADDKRYLIHRLRITEWSLADVGVKTPAQTQILQFCKDQSKNPKCAKCNKPFQPIPCPKSTTGEMTRFCLGCKALPGTVPGNASNLSSLDEATVYSELQREGSVLQNIFKLVCSGFGGLVQGSFQQPDTIQKMLTNQSILNSNSSESGVLGHIHQEQLIKDAQWKGTYPSDKQTLFVYICDVNRYYSQNPRIEHTRLFRKLRMRSSESVRTRFTQWREAQYRIHKKAMTESKGDIMDESSFHGSKMNKDDWLKFIIESLNLNPHNLDFLKYERMIRVLRDEQPTNAYSRIKGYMDQMNETRIYLNTIRGSDSYQIPLHDDKHTALLMYEVFVFNNNNTRFSNDSKLNRKIKTKLEKEFFNSVDFTLDEFHTKLTEIEGNVMPKSAKSTVKGECWVDPPNPVTNVFRLSSTISDWPKPKPKPKPKPRQQNPNPKPWKPYNKWNQKRGRTSLTLSTQKCTEGSRCKFLRNGACKSNHTKQDAQYMSHTPCISGLKCAAYQSGKCRWSHNNAYMFCRKCHGKGHAALHCNGKGDGQEKGRPVKQSPFIKYDPFNNPNPNSSYANIDRAKQAKLNSIKATNAKRVREIKAKAARDLSNLQAQMTLARNALGMTVTVPLSDDSSDECKDDSNPKTKAENEFAKSLNITTNNSKRGRQNRKRKVTDAFADVN